MTLKEFAREISTGLRRISRQKNRHEATLRAGTYDVYFGPADFRTPGEDPRAARARVVVAAGSLQDLALTLQPAAVVELAALDARSGAALPEFEVSVMDAVLATYCVKAGATIGGLLPGCVLRVSSEGYGTVERSLRAPTRETVRLALPAR